MRYRRCDYRFWDKASETIKICTSPAIGHLTNETVEGDFVRLTNQSTCLAHATPDTVVWVEVMQPRVETGELPCCSTECPLYEMKEGRAFCKATNLVVKIIDYCAPALLEIKEANARLRSEDVVKLAAHEAWASGRKTALDDDATFEQWWHSWIA